MPSCQVVKKRIVFNTAISVTGPQQFDQYEQVNDDIEEQRRLYEDMRFSKDNRTSGAGNHYLSKASSPEYQPAALKPVNPLYEYTRSEQGGCLK